MSTEQTIACKICGSPYVVYMFYAGDQSACPKCREKARANQGITTNKALLKDVFK